MTAVLLSELITRYKHPTIGYGSAFDLAVCDAPRKSLSLREVLSPLGLAIDQRPTPAIPFSTEELEAALPACVEATREQIRGSAATGFKGIFYRLQGAEPAHVTPMQYGGLVLEADRELLTEAVNLGITVLSIDGGAECYLDVVSDLPAQIFAWDSVTTATPDSEIRELRAGYTASADPASDFGFSGMTPPPTQKDELYGRV